MKTYDQVQILLEGSREKFLEKKFELKRGVMVKTLDCGIIVSVFKLQSSYYVNFQTNTLMNLLILQAMR